MQDKKINVKLWKRSNIQNMYITFIILIFLIYKILNIILLKELYYT